MFKVTLIVLLFATGACSGTWGGTKHVNRAGAAAVVTSMVLDWRGTRNAAARDWHMQDGRLAVEGGMPASQVMGSTPSVRTVDVYFLCSTVALLTVAQLLPERYRWILYGAVTGVEVYTVAGNLATTNIR